MDRVVANEAAARGLSVDEVRAPLRGRRLRCGPGLPAEDVTNMISFLASDAGQKISGQILAIDGHTETLAP